MRALKRAPCPCHEGAKTHTAPRKLRSAPTSRKHCGVCTMGERNADAPLAAEGSMVPSGTPGSFIAAARQCRSDGQRQHIPAAYPRSALPWQRIDAMRPEGGQVVAIFRRGAFSDGDPWHHSAAVPFRALVDGKTLAKCVPPASDSGKISPRCVFGLPAMAVFRRGAFSGGVQSWRDYAVVRSREAIRGIFFASCVPEGASDGKSVPSWQYIAAMHPKRAGFGKIRAPCIRKAPQTGVRGCTARIPCHEGALFAARAPQIMHGARILPSFGA